EQKNGMYAINFEINQDGELVQEGTAFISPDGKQLFLSAPLDLTEALPEPTTQTQEYAKNDKPVIDLFIMSHCPYGTQEEKAILPVINKLGDKVDFNVRFVYYAMHGETEIKEELNQYCIQKEQNNKYLNYLSCFLDAGNGTACLIEAEINTQELENCVAQADEDFAVTANFEDESSWLSGTYPLVNLDVELNEAYGVGGSPTLVINGITVNAQRNPASIMDAVCNSFTEAPSECSEEVSTETPTAGFGYSGTASTDSGSCS
ncbi:MAG: hypothetical protein ABH803_00460, partial [Candidatus Micrarchaeota archaeon]